MKIKTLATHREQLTFLNKRIEDEHGETIMFFQGRVLVGARTGKDKLPTKVQVGAEDFNRILEGSGIKLETAFGITEATVHSKVNPLSGKFYIHVYIKSKVKVIEGKEIKFI